MTHDSWLALPPAAAAAVNWPTSAWVDWPGAASWAEAAPWAGAEVLPPPPQAVTVNTVTATASDPARRNCFRCALMNTMTLPFIQPAHCRWASFLPVDRIACRLAVMRPVSFRGNGRSCLGPVVSSEPHRRRRSLISVGISVRITFQSGLHFGQDYRDAVEAPQPWQNLSPAMMRVPHVAQKLEARAGAGDVAWAWRVGCVLCAGGGAPSGDACRAGDGRPRTASLCLSASSTTATARQTSASQPEAVCRKLCRSMHSPCRS